MEYATTVSRDKKFSPAICVNGNVFASDAEFYSQSEAREVAEKMLVEIIRAIRETLFKEGFKPFV